MLEACHRCGRPLKNKRSRERGLGPTCWDIINGTPAPKKQVSVAQPEVEYDPDQYILFPDLFPEVEIKKEVI
jgi:hypothetical protein